jgi:hypothetical protein
MYHEHQWWFDSQFPERADLLYRVMKERENDSENGLGKKVYVKEKCP